MLKNISKRIAASNALRHGVNANGLLAWEDQSEFNAHLESTVESLAPRHPMLLEMAREIAWISWLQKRNHRAGEIFEHCDPFGAKLVEHRGQPDEAIQAAGARLKERDQELEIVAKVARKLDGLVDSADTIILKRTAAEILKHVRQIAVRTSMTWNYFVGLGDEVQRQADRAVDLQSKLQKMRAQYFELEQWLVTREKLLSRPALPKPSPSVDVDKELIEDNA